MLTNNWYNCFKNHYVCPAANNTYLSTIVATDGRKLKHYTDTTLLSYLFPMQVTILSTSFGSEAGVFFGDGNTPPTANDYTLSGNVLSGIVSKSLDKSFYKDGGNCVCQCDYIIQNNNDAAVTIREVAWVGEFKATSSSIYYYALFDRTLLDEPVTIEPGAIAKITYKRSVAMPTT